MSLRKETWQSHLDETKRGLARLLARENLSVRHANVPTAMFDLKGRTLTLPKWENISVDQYDLLIGHEVGHALYSDDFDALKDAANYPGLHTYINVLEDVRIERRIKDEFPGLRGAFSRGYKDFVDHGPIFQLEKPVAEYDFIDRINIQYKIGAHHDVPFSYDERMVLLRLEKCRTMTQIVALAKEMWNGQKKKNEEEKNAQADPKSAPLDSDETDESPAGAPGASKPESDETESKPESKPESESKEPDAGAPDTKENDAPAPETKNDSKDDAAPAPGTGDAPPENTDGQSPAAAESTTDPSAETDKANSDALESISQTDDSADPDQVDLAPLTDTVLGGIVVSSKRFVEDGIAYLDGSEQRPYAQKYLDDFNRKYATTIQHMAREFDRRKSAKLMERARTSRSGRIDLNKLASYKFREDIFQQVTILPNGKSHGIILLIDGSSSMGGVIGDVLDQVMLFTAFATKVNIPVQAFLFQSLRTDDAATMMPPLTVNPIGCELITLFDSTAGALKNQQLVLSGLAHQMNTTYGSVRMPHVHLGMTPLNSGLLIAERMVAKLKAARNLEKMTLIVMTDGDDNCGTRYNTVDPTDGKVWYATRGMGIYRDTVTRKMYNDVVWNDDYKQWRMLENAEAAMLVDSIQRRHGARVVRIHIVSNREAKQAVKYGAARMYSTSLIPFDPHTRGTDRRNEIPADFEAKLSQGLKANGAFDAKGELFYYDSLVLVSTAKLDLDEEDFSSKDTSGWTARKIAGAFTKSNVTTTKNRVFVNTVVPYLA